MKKADKHIFSNLREYSTCQALPLCIIPMVDFPRDFPLFKCHHFLNSFFPQSTPLNSAFLRAPRPDIPRLGNIVHFLPQLVLHKTLVGNIN